MTGIIFPHNGLIKKKASGGGATTQTSQLAKKTSSSAYSTVNVTNDTVSGSGDFEYAQALGDTSKSSGKLYFEVYFNVYGWGDNVGFGVMSDDDVASALTSTAYASISGKRLATDAMTAVRLRALDDNSSTGWNKSATGTSFQLSGATLTGVAACAVDLDNNKLWFGYENTARTSLSWTNSGDPSAGTGNLITQNETMNVVPFLYVRRVAANISYATLCSGSDTCKYTPPSGFNYWDAT